MSFALLFFSWFLGSLSTITEPSDTLLLVSLPTIFGKYFASVLNLVKNTPKYLTEFLE